jgi:Tol biopolymer transport system component
VGKFLISIAPATDFGRPATTDLALSPDGRRLVFSASSQRLDGSGRERKLYLRGIDNPDAEPMEGTEGGLNPVFSTKGDAVAFRTSGKLKSVGFDGGQPVELASVSPSFSNVGLSWFSNDDVLFADYGRGLSRTQPNRKEPISVTKPENGERHLFPVVLPGDQTILFTIFPASGGWTEAKIVAQSLIDHHQETLVEGGADARFIPPGYLVYMKSETLMAAQFDPKTWEIGQGVPMLEGVRVSLAPETGGGNTSAGQFAVSSSGDLVYVEGGARPDPVSTPVWVNRDGEEQPINAKRRLYRSPRLSFDDKRFAYISLIRGARDIWVHDFLRPETPLRQTFQYENTSPVWSPDGVRLLFSSTENSYRNIFLTVVDGKNRPDRLTTSVVESQDPMSWHGNYVLFTQRHEQLDPGTGRRAIMLLRVGENRTTPWLEPKGNYQLRQAEFSPDGRYVAYNSNQTNRWEVYIRPFEGDGPQIPISIHGGTEPVWSNTGELFYRNGGKVIAVEVTTTPALKVGKSTDLFKDIYETAGARPSPNYDVASDGRQFLMVKANPETAEPPTRYITIVTNWIEELQNKLSGPAK